MRDDEKHKIVLGFGQVRQEIEVTLPSDEPRPYDLDTKFDLVGKSHPRSDALAKVTGRAKYTYDIQLPGLLVAGFVRSPHARARLNKLDLSAVEKAPGVMGVLPLGVKNVRYAGQPIAAVAAESMQQLEDALALAAADYEILPHAARVEMALAENAPQVHGNRPNFDWGKDSPNKEAVSKALSESAKVVEAVATTQVQVHCALETHGVVAKWDDKHLTVWASTQSTFGVRDQLAEALKGEFGTEASDVTVISEFMGGGFGAKFAAGDFGLAAARLAKKTGRPVKFMLTRRAEMIEAGNRPDSEQSMKLGVTKDGKIAAYQVDVRGTPGVGRRADASNPMIYDFPRELVARRQADIATNAGEQQAFRAPGHPQASFAMETVLDLAAEALGMDPLEFRKLNDSNPVRLAQYVEGAKRIGWDARKPNGSAKGRMRRGLGVAASIWHVLGGPRAEVECRIARDGSVQIRNGAQDIGTGTRTLMQIIAAEELGLPIDRVTSFIGHTDDPIGPGSGGSTTAPSIAPAARQAAFLAARELRDLAAKHFGGKIEEFVVRGGKVMHVTDTGKSLAFSDACRLIEAGQISTIGKRKRNFDTYRRGVAGLQFADVEVDCDFGLVRVKKIVAIQDAGIIINRAAAESQVNGGVIQGISYALFEERVMDRHLGHMINADMEMYKIAGPMDMPEIDCVLMDVSNGGNNTSTAGIGEPTMVPTAAAIAGAVHNALGVRVKSLPLTPDKVLAALALKEKGK